MGAKRGKKRPRPALPQPVKHALLGLAFIFAVLLVWSQVAAPPHPQVESQVESLVAHEMQRGGGGDGGGGNGGLGSLIQVEGGGTLTLTNSVVETGGGLAQGGQEHRGMAAVLAAVGADSSAHVSVDGMDVGDLLPRDLPAVGGATGADGAGVEEVRRIAGEAAREEQEVESHLLADPY